MNPVASVIAKGRSIVERGSGSSHASISVLKALLGRCGMLALNCGTGILTARVLRPEGRGELSAMILWPVFLSGAFSLGLPSALLYTMKRNRQHSGLMISTAVAIGVSLSFVTAMLGFLLLPHWLGHYRPEIVRMAQLFMISTPATILVLIGRSAWEAEGRFGTSSASYVAAPLTALAVLLILLSIHRLTPITAAWAYVLSGVPPLIWMCSSLRERFYFRFRAMRSSAKELMSYGLRSYGIDLCGTLSQYVDQALVLGLLTAPEMGVYTVTLSLSRLINVVFVSTSAVLFPKAMEHDVEGSCRLAMRALIGSLALAIPGAIALIWGSMLAIRTLYGPEYLIATGLFRILVLEALLSGSISVMSQPFMAMGKPGTVTMFQAGGLLASIPLICLFVPRWGADGAGVALLISACLRGALLRYGYYRILPNNTILVRPAWDETKQMARAYIAIARRALTSSSAEAA